MPYLAEANGLPPVVAPVHPSSTLDSPANALFESMSGFTTTGATVLGDISFRTHTRGIMLWRQLTQWLGGMGIVVLAVAATLGNVGPGFGAVGPMGSYLGFPDAGLLFMTALMWAGRLEIIPVLVLLIPEYWQR